MTELIVICVYLAALLVLGVWATRWFRGTKQDYLLASHTIGPVLLLMSLFGTTMTAFALIGSSGEAYMEGIGVYGLMASSSAVIHSLCFFVIGLKLWKLGRMYGYSTQIEYFRDRLGSNAVGLLLFPVLVGLVIPYVLIGVMGAGITIQSMTAGAFPSFEPFQTASPATNGAVPTWLGSLVICAVVLIYVFLGGMRGTAWANAFQTVVFMALGIVTFVAIAMKLGQQGSLLADMQRLGEQIPFDKATRADMSKMMFFTYMLIPLSVGMFPHIFQHWLTAKNGKSFKTPIIWHPIFIMIVWLPCVLIGVWATTSLVPAHPPLPTLPDGQVNANAILPFLVKTQTSAVLGGLLAAGVLAAIMSSLDSQFLCLGTIFTNDIAAYYGRFSDRQQVWLARFFIVAIVAITYWLSLLDYRSVFTMAIWCFTGFAALVPLVLAALYWRRLTAAGAIASVLTMAGSWAYFFYQSDYGANVSYTVDVAWGGSTHQIMPVLPVLVCSTVSLVVVSLFTRPPDDSRLARFFPAE